ncbi:hypothetical protein EON64_15355, partial [archaeon]
MLTTTNKLLLPSGDLRSFGEEVAELFVQCFSQLSAQTPVYAALLSQLHSLGESAFASTVLARLEQAALLALERDEVVTVKLLLRALACLAAAGVVQGKGEEGLLSALQPLEELLGSSEGQADCFAQDAARYL